MPKLEYPVIIEPLPQDDGGGFVALVPDLPGRMSDGETAQAALASVTDAENPRRVFGAESAPRGWGWIVPFPDLRFRLLVPDCGVIPIHEREQEQHPGTDQYGGHCRSINGRR